MERRRIIVNADDLGLSPSVNTAILAAFHAGNLSSATFMTHMPGAADAVQRLPQHPGLAVGLHFNLTEGIALTGTSSLTDAEGRFHDRSTLAMRSMRGAIDPRHVVAELEAQLVHMRGWGLRPTHVDSHQHVLMTPVIHDAAIPVLLRERLPLRLVRPPWGTIRQDLARPKRMAKQLLNLQLARRLRARFTGPMNDRLVSVHDLRSDGPYDAATYQDLIARDTSGGVLEVMVHPYILGDDVMALYADVIDRKLPFLRRCAAEHEVLQGPPIFTEQHLITFADLPGA